MKTKACETLRISVSKVILKREEGSREYNKMGDLLYNNAKLCADVGHVCNYMSSDILALMIDKNNMSDNNRFKHRPQPPKPRPVGTIPIQTFNTNTNFDKYTKI